MTLDTVETEKKEKTSR